MQYELTEEQKIFRNEVRKLTKEKIAPRASEIDQEGKFPHDIYELLCKNKLMGVNFPEEYGGGGAEFLTCCIGIEEIARVCLNSALIPGVQELASTPLMIAGSPEQKWLASFCLTESEAGSDVVSMRTNAALKGDTYIINGAKCFISEADQAKVFTVFAKTNPDKGFKGISAFIVEKSFPGISIGKHEDKMGCRAIAACEVIFEDCELPKENLLGKEGEGLFIAFQTLDRTRPLVGASAVGLAQGALDYAVEYAKRRIQFQKPLATFQAIQFKLADVAMEIEAARQLDYMAAATIDRMDREKAWNKGRKLQLEVSKLGAMAKCYATDVAMKSTIEAAQVLGGYGYMKDYPMERHIRDARLLQIVEGTNEIQRMVIAEALFA
jgi:alkylation response protein AidB-like acyl-CoA dehydrogenase